MLMPVLPPSGAAICCGCGCSEPPSAGHTKTPVGLAEERATLPPSRSTRRAVVKGKSGPRTQEVWAKATAPPGKPVVLVNEVSAPTLPEKVPKADTVVGRAGIR